MFKGSLRTLYLKDGKKVIRILNRKTNKYQYISPIKNKRFLKGGSNRLDLLPKEIQDKIINKSFELLDFKNDVNFIFSELAKIIIDIKTNGPKYGNDHHYLKIIDSQFDGLKYKIDVAAHSFFFTEIWIIIFHCNKPITSQNELYKTFFNPIGHIKNKSLMFADMILKVRHQPPFHNLIKTKINTLNNSKIKLSLESREINISNIDPIEILFKLNDKNYIIKIPMFRDLKKMFDNYNFHVIIKN